MLPLREARCGLHDRGAGTRFLDPLARGSQPQLLEALNPEVDLSSLRDDVAQIRYPER